MVHWFFDVKQARSPEAKNKALRARLEALEKKGGDGVQGGKTSLPGEKAAWRMCGERTWTLRMRPSAAKN